MVNVTEVRHKCRKEASRFSYSINLFDRFPIWVFEYFKSKDPLASHSNSFTQIEIITIFMLINNIDAGLMMAFYNAGGQDVDKLFRLHDIFLKMWKKYRDTPPIQLTGVFGTFFTFHCETKSLRRVDMTIPQRLNNGRINNRFVPYSPHWERDRNTRAQIRNGKFKINNGDDLQRAKDAMFEGLLKQGRRRK